MKQSNIERERRANLAIANMNRLYVHRINLIAAYKIGMITALQFYTEWKKMPRWNPEEK